MIWNNIYSVISGGNNYNFSNDGSPNGELFLSDNVTSLHAGCFANSPNLTNIDLNKVTTLGIECLKNCTGLTNIDLSNVATIGNSALNGCSNISTMTIRNNVTVGTNTFDGVGNFSSTGSGTINVLVCDGSITMTTMITNLNNTTGTLGKSKIKTATLLSNITALTAEFFYGCTLLDTIILNDGLLTIGISAFRQTGIVSITIPNTVTSIGSNAFQGCNLLVNVSLPSLLTNISAGLFQDCISLQSITIPASIISADSSCFKGCTSLKTIIFNSIFTGTYLANQSTANMFYNCTALENVVLKNGWNKSIVISMGTSYFTNVLTHDCIVGLFNSLADLTGQTSQQLRIGSTNLSRVNATEIAIATNKNWTVL